LQWHFYGFKLCRTKKGC